MGGYGLIRFPIVNYGHTTASHITVSSHFERGQINLSTTAAVLLDARDLAVSGVPTIIPSEKPTFYMAVFIPQQGSSDYRFELAKGTQYLVARGFIAYDSGFGERDTAAWCYDWQPSHSRWESCHGSAEMWLDKAQNAAQQNSPKN